MTRIPFGECKVMRCGVCQISAAASAARILNRVHLASTFRNQARQLARRKPVGSPFPWAGTT